jgi:hypothetical protein
VIPGLEIRKRKERTGRQTRRQIMVQERYSSGRYVTKPDIGYGRGWPEGVGRSRIVDIQARGSR